MAICHLTCWVLSLQGHFTTQASSFIIFWGYTSGVKLLTENKGKGVTYWPRGLKLDDAVWESRRHRKRRASLISAALLVQNRRDRSWSFLSSARQEKGTKPVSGLRRPLHLDEKRRCSSRSSGGSSSSAEVCKLCDSTRQTELFRPKSQMVFGAFGTSQSQRLKKLSAVFIVAESRSREQRYTTMLWHFKAAFNVVLVVLQLLCRPLTQISPFERV